MWLAFYLCYNYIDHTFLPAHNHHGDQVEVGDSVPDCRLVYAIYISHERILYPITTYWIYIHIIYNIPGCLKFSKNLLLIMNYTMVQCKIIINVWPELGRLQWAIQTNRYIQKKEWYNYTKLTTYRRSMHCYTLHTNVWQVYQRRLGGPTSTVLTVTGKSSAWSVLLYSRLFGLVWRLLLRNRLWCSQNDPLVS